jgi:fucose 4-O-acetylase-like acetyltransferase
MSQWYGYEVGKGGSTVEPTRVLPAVSALSLVSVEYGGWALLGFLTGRGQLGQFREQFFRAGHAHAGVLLVLSLVYFSHLDRTGYSERVQWFAGSLLLAGIMAQSGGFFLHLGLGQPDRSSLGTIVTRFGALLIASALVVLAFGLITSGRRGQ